MSKGGLDLEYKPRTTTVKPIRTSRRTRKVEPVDYFEAESDTDKESEVTLSGSSSSTLVVDCPGKKESQLEGEDNRELENLWTLGTLNSNEKQVGEQVSRLTERNRQSEMTETSNVERMLEMMLTMRQDEQRREEKRE